MARDSEPSSRDGQGGAARSDVSSKDLADLVQRIEAAARSGLSPKRYKHSEGCARFAAFVCSRAGIDPNKGLAAGWAHDLAKELPPDEQRGLASDCPVAVPGTIFHSDLLLHGPAAATLLWRDFGVRDVSILEAVALHTVGRADMGALAKIIWAADKMEEGRRHVDEAYRRRCMELDPNELLAEALSATIAWLRSKGREVAPETLDLYNAIREEIG